MFICRSGFGGYVFGDMVALVANRGPSVLEVLCATAALSFVRYLNDVSTRML